MWPCIYLFYLIIVFIPGDGMIQEEELEAVVRACLQVHKSFEMPFTYPKYSITKFYTFMTIETFICTMLIGKWNDLARE